MSTPEPQSSPLAPYGAQALGELASRAPQPSERDIEDAADDVLWQRYRHTGDLHARETLIVKHLPYARSVAGVLFRQHVHHEVEFREYVQWATLGLIEALDRYDPERGARFTTYAYTRMQGAIRNGLQHISERQEQIGLRRRLLAERVQSATSGADLQAPSERLLDEMTEVGTVLVIGFMLDGSGMVQDPADTLPDGCYEAAVFRQERQRLMDMLPHLTPREQSVVRMHYFQCMTYEDTAQALRITKGRVAQLHQQAIERLRRLLAPETIAKP